MVHAVSSLDWQMVMLKNRYDIQPHLILSVCLSMKEERDKGAVDATRRNIRFLIITR